MTRTVWLIVGAVCAVGVGYGLSVAQEDAAPVVALTAENVRASTFESLTVRAESNNPIGVTETLHRDGYVIVLVELDVSAPWSEELESVSVSGDQIALMGPDQAKYMPIGYFQWGTFSDFSPSLSMFRPSDWREPSEPTPFNAAFLVPAGGQDFTLVLGDSLSVPVSAPAETVPPPHILDKMRIEIVSAKLVHELHGATDVDEKKVPTDVVNPAGGFLEVTLKITPLASNGSFADTFFWHSDWFGVRFADGSHSHTVGEIFMDGLTRNVSHNTARSGRGWDSETATFYFPATANTTSFTLLVQMRDAAEGTVD